MTTHANERTKFKEATISQLRELNREKRPTDKGVKFCFDSTRLVGHLARHFVNEVVARATAQAQSEGLSRVDLDHLRKILSQLLLDFA